MTVMALAEQHPELFGDRVVAVALVATRRRAAGRGDVRRPRRRRQGVAPGGTEGSQRTEPPAGHGRPRPPLGADIEFVLTKRYSFATDVPPSLVLFASRMHDATPLDVIAELFPAFDAHDKLEALNVLNGVETLVLGGEQDRMTPADHSREMVARVPGAELVIIPEAGHLVMLEHHDLVSDHLRDLVERARRVRMPGMTADPGGRCGRDQTWDELVAAVQGCVACDELAASRTRVVPAPAGRRCRGPARGGGARRPGGRDGGAVRRAVGTAARPAARRCGAAPRPGSRGQCAEVPAAGQPHAAPGRGRALSALADPPGRARRPACGGRARQHRGGVVLRAIGARIGARCAASSHRTYDGRALLVTYHPSAAIRFGPNGEPLAALRDDLAAVAALLAVPS